MKTEYVLGFLFDTNKENVILIHKTHGPESIIGKWNGVGGEMELGESPISAMCRENLEETGMPNPHWREFCIYSGGVFTIHCLVAQAIDIHECRTMTDETVSVFPARNLPSNLAYGVDFLIPMAIASERFNLVEITDRDQ